MKIGVLGTGMVGQAISGKLVELGHDVVVGTRDVTKTMEKTEPNAYGAPSFSVWQRQYPKLKVGTYDVAAHHGELLFNATNGTGTMAALMTAGESNLNGKVLVDIANPLDFSAGSPPTLSICNGDSLAEEIQRSFPQLKVVKTLNTVTASLMVNPNLVANGDHQLFISGNNEEAKAQVSDILRNWFGWQHILDLGDITTARGTEMYLALWLRMWGSLGTGLFNVKIMR